MSTDNPLKNFVVGFVFLGGLLIVGIATLAIKGLPWADAQVVSIRFPRIDNLRVGEDVLIHGYRVGQVDEIRFEPGVPDKSIVVSCTLQSEIPLTRNTEFIVRSAGPLGGRYLEIVPAQGDPVRSDFPDFRGRADGDLFEQIRQFVEENREPIREGKGLLGKVIRDEEFASSVDEAIAEFRDTFRRINEQIGEGDGLLGRLFNDKELADQVKSSVGEFETTFRKLNAEDGILETVSRDLREQSGIIGLLLSDPEAKEDLKKTLDSVQEVIESVRSGQGLLGQLIRDEELAARVRGVVEDVQDITRKINVGEGTLGQVVNNREAWDELVRVLVLAREAIEDLREQAPISTFANVLFTVF